MEGIHLARVRSLVDSAQFSAILYVPSGDLCDGNASQNMTYVLSRSQLECAEGNCVETMKVTGISGPHAWLHRGPCRSKIPVRSCMCLCVLLCVCGSVSLCLCVRSCVSVCASVHARVSITSHITPCVRPVMCTQMAGWDDHGIMRQMGQSAARRDCNDVTATT